MLRRLASRLLIHLFSVNEVGFSVVCGILLIVEAVLSHLVILKVPYTEIDWSTYMQQVECYVKKGALNYTDIGGDTGPVVYPAGHIFVYRVLYFFTNSGKNIRAAQHIFQGFYILNLVFVFRILYKTMRIPPFVLFLVTVTGYRIHSIFMLRLFNDPLAMLLFYVAMDRFLDQKWLVGCVFYSLAVSIKMNVLLFAPALFVTLLLNTGVVQTIGYIGVCGVIQLYVGSPFLLHDWKSYVTRSFDLGRVFMFKWTVNWRFLPEEIFLDKRLHIALLVGHLTFLAVFAWVMWFRRLNGLRPSLSLLFFRGITTATGPLDTFYAFCTSNLIGIAFSRSLHYQFYSWYFHQLPFLLFCDYPHVSSVAHIPWKSFFWKVPLLLAVELSWNVYPSTWWSSALLHICHVIIIAHLIATRARKPQDDVDPATTRMLQRRTERLKKTYEKHGQVVPKSLVPIVDDGNPISASELVSKPPVKPRRKKNETRFKTTKEMDDAFEEYYANEMKTFRDVYKVYVGKDGQQEVTGLPPLGDKSKLKLHEKVKALYAQALALQEQLESEKNSNSNGSVQNGTSELHSEVLTEPEKSNGTRRRPAARRDD